MTNGHDLPNLSFVQNMANPFLWLLTSDNLHNQVMNLNKFKMKSTIIFHNTDDKKTIQRDLINKSAFILGGFALENAIKAFLVYENPNWISNGTLSRELRSHHLLGLQRRSKLIPYKTKYLFLLNAFECGLESWARYPCALSHTDSTYEEQMTDRIWDGYITIMRAYHRKLVTLLRAGWKGPHDFYGRWKIDPTFFD